jgi:hypothetical protein
LVGSFDSLRRKKMMTMPTAGKAGLIKIKVGILIREIT